MKSLFAVGFLFVGSLAAGVEQDIAKHEALGRDMVKAMENLVDAFAGVKDADSAKVAAGKIEKVCDRLEELTALAVKLPKLAKADDDKVTKKFEPEMKRIEKKLGEVALQAGLSSGGEPTFIASLKRLEIVGKKMENVGKGAAGGDLDPDAKSTFGSVKLKAGFAEDPFTKELVAGGNIKTNKGGVAAFVAKEPDFVLEYEAGKFVLTIHAESKDDTTLLIRLPDGTWAANDDRAEKDLNPLLKFEKPQSGRYAIWVGTFGPKNAPAVLKITEKKVN